MLAGRQCSPNRNTHHLASGCVAPSGVEYALGCPQMRHLVGPQERKSPKPQCLSRPHCGVGVSLPHLRTLMRHH